MGCWCLTYVGREGLPLLVTDSSEASAPGSRGNNLSRRCRLEGVGPAAVGFDHLVDLSHDPNRLAQGYHGISRQGAYPDYDVTGDGQRFVLFPDDGQGQTSSGHVTLIINWFDELERLVPTDP